MAEDGSSRRTFLKGAVAGGLGVALAGGAYTQRDVLLGGDDTDHLEAISELVPEEQVTHTATGGDWTAEETWQSAIPGDDTHVRIPAETTVRLGSELTARLATVRVDGRLTVDPETAARLPVDTFVITESGTLEIGTAEEPVTGAEAVVEFLDRGPIDEDWDPDRVSRGLLALPGSTVEIHGAERTPFAAVTDPPETGDESLALEAEPTGWESGDQLVLAGVHPDENQDEEVTVEAVEGATVRLSDALDHDHVPPRDSFDAYVAHLDRSVQCRSETDRTKRRGHVMFMTEDVTVRNAGFYDLGRTDKSRPVTNPANGAPPDPDQPNPKARYACHFHRTGIEDRNPREVSGCVVWGSPGWGYVNHNSNVEFLDNISYQVFGAGFVAEIGNEIGAFRGNFALRSTGTGRLPDHRQFREGKEDAIDDFGHGGYGFWFQSPGVAVEDNVAAGHRHHGFVWWLRPKPDREMDPERFEGITADFANFPLENVDGQQRLAQSDDAADGAVPSHLVAIRSFANNTVFASGGGVDISRHRFGDAHDDIAEYSVVENFTAFNVGSLYSPWDSLRVPNRHGGAGGENGISVRYSANVVLRNVTLVSGAGGHRGVGINRNHAPTNVRIENADLEGWHTGIRAMPRGTSPIEGAQLDNEIDVHVIGGGTDRRWSPPQQVSLSDVSFADGGRARLFLGTDLQDDVYGLFDPSGGVSLEDSELYFASQQPDVVPFPRSEDLQDVDGDALGDLGDVDPSALAGQSNRDLYSEYGLAVEGEPVPQNAGREDEIEGGFVAGATGSGDRSGPILDVLSAVGSCYEIDVLAQGKPLYVYDEETLLTVPGKYAGLPFVRPEREDEDIERRSGYRLELSTPATVFVAYDAEASADWLSDWTDTGDTLGTEDGVRAVYRRDVDAGATWLGGCENTSRMYTAFVRPE